MIEFEKEYPKLIQPGYYSARVCRVHKNRINGKATSIFVRIMDYDLVDRLIKIGLPIKRADKTYAQQICKDYQIGSFENIKPGWSFYVEIKIKKHFLHRTKSYVVYNTARILTQKEMI